MSEIAELPEAVRRLLWDTEPGAVDLQRHASFVMERVMARGTWEAMQWLRRTYPDADLARFVRERGSKCLAPRELAYWSLLTGVDVPIPRGAGRPAWAGP